MPYIKPQSVTKINDREFDVELDVLPKCVCVINYRWAEDIKDRPQTSNAGADQIVANACKGYNCGDGNNGKNMNTKDCDVQALLDQLINDLKYVAQKENYVRKVY